MKKILIPALFVILLLFSISNIIYFPGFKVWSFDEVISFNKESITSIYIRSNDNETHITDPTNINKVFNDLSKMELSKRKFESDVKKSDSSANNQKYIIELEDSNGDLVEMIYLSGNLFKIYGYSTEETVVYEIVNDPALDLPNIFNSTKN